MKVLVSAFKLNDQLSFAFNTIYIFILLKNNFILLSKVTKSSTFTSLEFANIVKLATPIVLLVFFISFDSICWNLPSEKCGSMMDFGYFFYLNNLIYNKYFCQNIISKKYIIKSFKISIYSLNWQKLLRKIRIKLIQ